MVKRHGSGKQKKLAKQKAKRLEKRSKLLQLNSKDPTIRLRRAEKWPVVHALVAAKLWEDGIGYLAIARQEAEGRLVFGAYLVDVYCLGVKNAFWSAGTPGDFTEMIERMEETQAMIPISPACLVKIVERRSSTLSPLASHLTPTTGMPGCCSRESIRRPAHEYTFGRDGKPFYIQGPNESPAQVSAIMQRIQEAGGHFLVQASGTGSDKLADFFEGGDDEFDLIEDEDLPDESP